MIEGVDTEFKELDRMKGTLPDSMETSGKPYEECRSLNHELTFETLQAEMAARNIEFGHRGLTDIGA